MKNEITLTDSEIYTAIIALFCYEALASKSPLMDKKSKSLEVGRASALLDKLKKLVQPLEEQQQ
jgi:hypothetical protein